MARQHRSKMWPFSAGRQPHSVHLARVVKRHFASKINRGMKIRNVGENQLLLEDTDEWLDSDTTILKVDYKEILHFDIYACTSYETSISGLCVSVTIVPHSRVWDFIGLLLSLVTYMTFMSWVFVFSRTHGILEHLMPVVQTADTS